MKLLFVINPVAGTSRKKTEENRILKFFNAHSYDVSIEHTSGQGSAGKITESAIKSGYHSVIAVGGDGTVNEVAHSLTGSNVTLGIIPRGSGNGLARHHKIPFAIDKALEVIHKNHTVAHDAIRINEYLSFNVSGIGFDAHVANLFGNDGNRGLYGYLKLVMTEFSAYNEKQFRIFYDGGELVHPAMMLSIANSTQFGNEAVIAPYANTGDGIADLTLVRKMPWWKLPVFTIMVFSKRIASSKYATFIAGKEFTIQCSEKLPLHIDGESKEKSDLFNISVIKNAVELIVP